MARESRNRRTKDSSKDRAREYLVIVGIAGTMAIVGGAAITLLTWWTFPSAQLQSVLMTSSATLFGTGIVLAGVARYPAPSAKATRQRIAELRAQVTVDPEDERPDAELLDLESTVEFEAQASRARSGSRLMLVGGIALVTFVIVGGVVEIWWNTNSEVELSTGDGIVRASVIGAVFYLAGQMFRRATSLEQRADDLERAVIALRYGKGLADDIDDLQQRNLTIAQIYVSHLAARPTPTIEDSTVSDLIAAVLKRS